MNCPLTLPEMIDVMMRPAQFTILTDGVARLLRMVDAGVSPDEGFGPLAVLSDIAIDSGL